MQARKATGSWRTTEQGREGVHEEHGLATVRIHTLDDVAKLGMVETYQSVNVAHPGKVLLNMLWGLQRLAVRYT